MKKDSIRVEVCREIIEMIDHHIALHPEANTEFEKGYLQGITAAKLDVNASIELYEEEDNLESIS